jgi:hypothetical protein
MKSNRHSKKLNSTAKIVLSILIRISILAIVLFIPWMAGCEKEDVGKCTIMTYSGNEVYDNISIEECQQIFYDTPGVRGWKWEPKK